LEENNRPDVLFVRTSARVRVYPTDAVLPADGFLPSADAVKTASARTRPCIREDAKKLKIKKIKKIKIKIKKLKNFFLVVVAGLEREKFFSIFGFRFSVFGFRFSIPKIPKLPELRGLRRRSREKKL
jgi:hypothetical protein